MNAEKIEYDFSVKDKTYRMQSRIDSTKNTEENIKILLENERTLVHNRAIGTFIYLAGSVAVLSVISLFRVMNNKKGFFEPEGQMMEIASGSAVLAFTATAGWSLNEYLSNSTLLALRHKDPEVIKNYTAILNMKTQYQKQKKELQEKYADTFPDFKRKLDRYKTATAKKQTIV